MENESIAQVTCFSKQRVVAVELVFPKHNGRIIVNGDFLLEVIDVHSCMFRIFINNLRACIAQPLE